MFLASFFWRKEVHLRHRWLWIALVELKTKVAANSLGALLELLRLEATFCNFVDDNCSHCIPWDHIIQVVQKATVMGAFVIIYSVASENGTLYTMTARLTSTTKQDSVNSLNKVVETVMG